MTESTLLLWAANIINNLACVIFLFAIVALLASIILVGTTFFQYVGNDIENNELAQRKKYIKRLAIITTLLWAAVVVIPPKTVFHAFFEKGITLEQPTFIKESK